MHKIEIPADSSSDCFDSVAYSMLKHYHFDYEAYNIKYFYTDYYCLMEKCIIRGKPQNDVLKLIYNIDLISEDKSEELDLAEIIAGLVNRVPIGIFIDLYHCPWLPFFNKAYFSHCLLIVDVDYKNKKFLCFDVYYDKVGYAEVDMDIIFQHYESYFVFDFEKAEEVKLEILLNRINRSLNNHDSDTDKKAMDIFNFYTLNDRKILFPDNLETTEHLVNLMWIAEDKKHFSTALRYIEKRIGTVVFSPIYELLANSNNVFSILVSMLIKYAMTGKIKEEKLKNIIDQILLTDNLIVNQMSILLREINSPRK